MQKLFLKIHNILVHFEKRKKSVNDNKKLENFMDNLEKSKNV